MSVDKKVLDGDLRLVLLQGIGKSLVTGDFNHDDLNATLENYGNTN
jgi:3-dehydroquinate synthase